MDWGGHGAGDSARLGDNTGGLSSTPNTGEPSNTALPPPPLPGQYQFNVFSEGGDSEQPGSTGTQMPGSGATTLCQTYYRCRAARDPSFSDKAVEISCGINLGCVLGGEVNRIGSFDGQGTAINTCFVGSGIMKGNVEVNQNISLTFDPPTMRCIACESRHRILGSDSLVGICVTDQNFPANLSGKGNCISVVRLESASLPELADFCGELFNNYLPFSIQYYCPIVQTVQNSQIYLYALSL